MEVLADVEEFLKSHDGFELVQDNRKVRCKLTGHEMPCDITVLNKYVSGKKYQRLTGKGTCTPSGSQKYKQYLQPVSNKREKLFCVLTRKTISNTPACIERHVQGKRFQKALQNVVDGHGTVPTADVKEMDGVEVNEENGNEDVEEDMETADNQHPVDTGQQKEGTKKKTNQTKAEKSKHAYNPDEEGSEEGEEDLEQGTVVLWVPSDHEFEEDEEDPWASYFDDLKPDEELQAAKTVKSKTKSEKLGIGKSRKRKSNKSYELSYQD